MLKKILIGLLILTAIVILLGAIGVWYFLPNERNVLSFIKQNPDRAAMLLIRNDTIIAKQNINKVMPLASTVKIILAIEYAIQSSKGIINPNELISLSELEKYYIPDTDGDAHPNWLKSVKKTITDNKISITEIAKGMIRYSSNANTEWLLNKLGAENVNNRIDSLELKNHTKIYNIVSALFVGTELFPKEKEDIVATKLKNLSIEKYIATSEQIHKKLENDTTYKNTIGELSLPIQKLWSDNLPSSTVEDYVSIMKKINSRNYFDSVTQKYLDEVMEYILENPANRGWLEHSGMKGGSTAFVLTKALYATDKKGNKTEMAYFLNDLTIPEITKLQMSMNKFELKILTNKEFRQKIKDTVE